LNIISIISSLISHQLAILYYILAIKTSK